MSDKRTGWLAELTVGSEVGVTWSTGGLAVGRVTKVTPTGQLDVEVGGHTHRFTRHGDCRVTEWGSHDLRPADDDFRAKVDHQAAVEALRAHIRALDPSITRLRSMPAETIREASRLLADATALLKAPPEPA